MKTLLSTGAARANDTYTVSTTSISEGELVSRVAAAVLNALEEGRIYGAGIDAFSEEPPKDERWFKLDNVVLGSHCAASTAGAASNMGTMATENIIRDLGL